MKTFKEGDSVLIIGEVDKKFNAIAGKPATVFLVLSSKHCVVKCRTQDGNVYYEVPEKNIVLINKDDDPELFI